MKDDQRIKLSQELSKIPGMEESPLVLVKISHYMGSTHYEVMSVIDFEEVNEVYDAEIIGPWLKVDDDSKWSSAKIIKATLLEIKKQNKYIVLGKSFILDLTSLDDMEMFMVDQILDLAKHEAEALQKALEPLLKEKADD